MSATSRLTPRAVEDLEAIWWQIAEDSRDAADRVEMEIIAACRRLAKHPLIGTKRQDYHRGAGALLDDYKAPKLCACVPSRDCPAASDRRLARKT